MVDEATGIELEDLCLLLLLLAEDCGEKSSIMVDDA
jgi:hypothetical protein